MENCTSITRDHFRVEVENKALKNSDKEKGVHFGTTLIAS
jgi:hypothetical protein